MAALYAAVFGWFTCVRHARFQTYAYDLGTFDQGIWLAGQGGDLFVTVRGLHLLGDHVRLFSFVLAPLYWVWDDVRALLVLQSIVIAAGAFFLCRIAQRELPNRPWLVLSICAGYLLHPAVQNLNLDHAHPDAFASTFLLVAIDALRGGRRLVFAVAAMLAMSCKEDVALVFVALGLALMLDRSQRRFGAALVAASALWFVVSIGVILPTFNGVGFYRFGRHGFWSGVAGHSADPWWLVQKLWQPTTGTYLFSLGLPNLFLFLLHPISAAAALPALAANLLSDARYPRDLAFHYQTSILPFLYLATIDAMARWNRVNERPAQTASPRRLRGVAQVVCRAMPALLLVAAAGSNLAWSKLPWTRTVATVREATAALRETPRYASYSELLARIPKDAVVSADLAFVPHLSHRRGVYMFPNPFRTTYWGIHAEDPHDPSVVDYLVVHARALNDPVLAQAAQFADLHDFEFVDGDHRTVALYKRAGVSPTASCGDWNGDGDVTREDQRSIAKAILIERECPPRVCDADGNGLVNSGDVSRVGQHSQDASVALVCPGD